MSQHDSVLPGQPEELQFTVDVGVVRPFPKNQRVKGLRTIDFKTVGDKVISDKPGFGFKATGFVKSVVEEEEALTGEVTCKVGSHEGRSC